MRATLDIIIETAAVIVCYPILLLVEAIKQRPKKLKGNWAAGTIRGNIASCSVLIMPQRPQGTQQARCIYFSEES